MSGTALAAALAATILVLHELVVALRGGTPPDGSYLVFTLVLCALGPLLLELAARLVPERRRPAVWGAATGALGLGAGLGPFAGLGAAAALLAVLWTAFERRLDPRAIGLGVGAGTALALDLVPALASWGVGVFALAPLHAIPAATTTGSVLLVLVLGQAALGSFGLTVAVALLLALGAPLEAWWRTPYEQEPAVLRPEVSLLPEAPHVLVVVLDTVRADQLSIAGYERDTTPELARFLAGRPRARVHTATLSNGSWTVPSHASLLTGELPSSHGAHLGSPAAELSVRAAATLAERFREAGYRTIGVFANPWLRRVDGLARGFEVWALPPHRFQLPRLGEGLRTLVAPGVLPDALEPSPQAEAVLAAFTRHLEACAQAPCFGFVNLLDAHAPYVPTAACRGRFAPAGVRSRYDTRLRRRASEAERERLRARYDEELCDLDRALVSWLEELEARGFLDRAWLFLTSDHGESFGEHDTTEHGTSVYDEQVRVPLVVLPPRGTELALGAGVASLVDVAATAVAVAGLPALGSGRDLRDPTPRARAAVEFYGDPRKVRQHGPKAGEAARAVRVGSTKLIARGELVELYDLATDPGEQEDRAAYEPERVRALRALLPPLSRLPSRGARAAPQLGERDREALRSLGYLE